MSEPVTDLLCPVRLPGQGSQGQAEARQADRLFGTDARGRLLEGAVGLDHPPE